MERVSNEWLEELSKSSWPAEVDDRHVENMAQELLLLRGIADLAREAIEQFETRRVMKQRTIDAIKISLRNRSGRSA